MKFWVWLDDVLVGWVIASDLLEAESAADVKFPQYSWGVRRIEAKWP